MPRWLSLFGRFLGFAFGPFRALPTFLQWVPSVIAVLAFVLAVVGISIPEKIHVSRSTALTLAASALALLFLVSAVRLWFQVHPPFPRHKIALETPWVINNPETDGEKLVLFDVGFTNRETDSRVHLTIDLLCHRLPRQAGLEPLRLFPYTRPIGSLETIARPTDVAPQGRVDGAVVFSDWVPGVTQGEEGSEFTAPPDRWEFFVRLTDDLSGTELEVPLKVARQADVETALAELAPSNRKVVGFLDFFETGGIRLGLKNEGGEDLEGQLVNLFIPRAWSIFRPCDENGNPISRGNLMEADEDLRGPDGQSVPARIWTYREREPLAPGVTNLYFFEYEADPGDYPVSLRLHGFKANDLVVTVEPPDAESEA